MNTLPIQPIIPPMPKPNVSENKGLEIKFELDGDYIYKSIPISRNDIYTECREEVVMDKKTFIEAFEKWIERRA